jgi:hypothetical protein
MYMGCASLIMTRKVGNKLNHSIVIADLYSSEHFVLQVRRVIGEGNTSIYALDWC